MLNNFSLIKIFQSTKTLFYSENPDEEGLLYSYEEEIGKVLKKENKIRTMLLKYMKK